MTTIIRQSSIKRISRRTSLVDYAVVEDLSDTADGRIVLRDSEFRNCAWRAALEGHIKSVKYVRVTRYSYFADHQTTDSNPEVQTGLEIETDQGVGFVNFMAGSRDLPGFEVSEIMNAFVSNRERKAVLCGTWRKHGKVVGHACSWIDSHEWKVGRKGRVPRRGKSVEHGCGVSLFELATGESYRDGIADRLREHHQAQEVRRAKAILAREGAA